MMRTSYRRYASNAELLAQELKLHEQKDLLVSCIVNGDMSQEQVRRAQNIYNIVSSDANIKKLNILLYNRLTLPSCTISTLSEEDMHKLPAAIWAEITRLFRDVNNLAKLSMIKLQDINAYLVESAAVQMEAIDSMSANLLLKQTWDPFTSEHSSAPILYSRRPDYLRTCSEYSLPMK